MIFDTSLTKQNISGETDVVWCFNDQSVIDKFVTTADSDHNEGYSSCKLEMSEAGRARFHGHLDLRVPKDGRIKKAGYCAIRSQRIRVRKDQFLSNHTYSVDYVVEVNHALVPPYLCKRQLYCAFLKLN